MLTPREKPMPATPMRRWWSRRLLWGFMLLFGIFTGIVAWASWHGSSRLRETIAKIEQTDPHWRIAEIEARRDSIPDTENSALLISAAKKLIDRGKIDSNRENAAYERLDELLARRSPTARANDEEKNALKTVLSANEPAMTEYRKLIAMPRGRFPIKYSPDFIGTMLNVQDARDAVRILQLDVYDRLEAGDVQGAQQSVKALFHAARSVGDEPLLISMRVRIACESIGLASLEGLLAQAQFNDESLGDLQRILVEDARVPLLTLACRGERAGGFELFEFLKSNRNSGGYLSSIGAGMGGGGPAGRIWEFVMLRLPGSMSGQQADCLQFMTQAVEASKLPLEEHAAAFVRLDQSVKNLGLMARLLCPSIVKVSQANLRWQAQIRCAIVAIAAERYRLRHGRWPEQLNDLVIDKLLDAIPRDPFDALPLRWKATDQGRLVYSVGKDRIDNQGRVDPDKTSHDDYDLGFRLFDPQLRRSQTRPIKTEPDVSPDDKP